MDPLADSTIALDLRRKVEFCRKSCGPRSPHPSRAVLSGRGGERWCELAPDLTDRGLHTPWNFRGFSLERKSTNSLGSPISLKKQQQYHQCVARYAEDGCSRAMLLDLDNLNTRREHGTCPRRIRATPRDSLPHIARCLISRSLYPHFIVHTSPHVHLYRVRPQCILEQCSTTFIFSPCSFAQISSVTRLA
jgi:hypothetical protein